MSSVDGDDVFAVSSALTLTEILTLPLRLGKTELVNSYEEILLNGAHFYLAPIDTKTSRIAADLRARYNLKTPDALQVASALNESCDAFLTNDLSIKRITEIQILILDELELV
ncbi:MAG: PIN domain-containing protein [Chloroflexota bacterium]